MGARSRFLPNGSSPTSPRKPPRSRNPRSNSCWTGTWSCASSSAVSPRPKRATTPARISPTFTRTTTRSAATRCARRRRRCSRGWGSRMRLNLARALMRRADLLLLDEPTNHLDLDAVLWLEDWLRVFPGAVILITHDREFLDAVAGEIVHIEHLHLNAYAGNYSAFEAQRSAR